MNPIHAATVVASIAAGTYGLYLIWRYGLCPAWRTIMAINHFAEALPILIDIADEFQPNHGTTLRDAIDKLSADHDSDHTILVEQTIALNNITQQLEQLCNGGV